MPTKKKPAPNKKPTRRKRMTSEELKEELQPIEEKEVCFDKVLSTGSTLLDLTISGGVTPEGGVPGGIIMEVSGPNSCGKTAILSELAGSAQRSGGEVGFKDPEARLNKEYAKIYGFEIDEKLYSRPDTVTELFEDIWNWKPKNPDVINAICADSLASLSTRMEMEDEDKMGMRRAKEFSEGLRKTARIIANNNWLIACSNQLRMGTGNSYTTPGGLAIPYYSSLRIAMKPLFKGSKIKKTATIGSKEIQAVLGVTSECGVIKSSIDEPYRTCNVSIIFGYGIDDIRENLMFIKNHTGNPKFLVGNKEYAANQINAAIKAVEDNDLEEEIRQETIALWHEIREKLRIERKRKRR